MASVRIEKLCKTFDEKTNVVDDVSVCIRDNEFVVIVGPSGCGKTTTLNIRECFQTLNVFVIKRFAFYGEQATTLCHN